MYIKQISIYLILDKKKIFQLQVALLFSLNEM